MDFVVSDAHCQETTGTRISDLEISVGSRALRIRRFIRHDELFGQILIL